MLFRSSASLRSSTARSQSLQRWARPWEYGASFPGTRKYPCQCRFPALGTLGRSGLAGDGALGAELRRRETGGEATAQGFQAQSGCWLVQNRGEG